MTPIYLVGYYYHIPEYSLYIWLFIAFWLFDRVARGLRMLWINQGKRTSRQATVEVLCQDSVRLVLPNRHMTWSAGQHVYLTLPGISNILFESHPLTIANIPERDENGKTKPTDLVFYTRALDGFTRKLYDYALLHHGGGVVAVADGPYGCPPQVNTFSTVLLIAGGSGVASTLPLLLEVVSASRRNETPVKRVVFLWAVKDEGDLKWAMKELITIQSDVSSNLSIDIRIHVTGATGLVPALGPTPGEVTPSTPPEKDRSLDNSATASRSDDLAKVDAASIHEGQSTPCETGPFRIRFGRPDLGPIIQEEISASTGPVCVASCGPSTLSKTVRAALRSGAAGPSAALHGGVPVSMHIEEFDVTRARK